MTPIKIFVSSVQREFAEERAMLSAYIRNDVLLGKFFDVFIFEESPAQAASAQEVYLEQVRRCDIYLGIFGNEYGNVDSEGISPTEREYDQAAELSKPRLIFIKKDSDNCRDEREKALIAKAENKVVRKSFTDINGLRTAVYASLIRYLEHKEIIRMFPFDASKDTTATLDDLDEEKIRDFIYTARRKRNFPLVQDTPPEKLLTHLDLIDDDGKIKNAAVLLFGKKPQKYFITSEVKCIQFFGNKVEKPLPAYQIYKGDVFSLVDQATSFVMSRLNNWTGSRNENGTASIPTRPELPMEAVQEAIVNAVCHRDYRSNGSVQVMLFRNRLEIWNPGILPFGLTVKKLYEDHKSIPANPLLAEPMYYKGYIEKAGTGTEDIVSKCQAYGLPTPLFQQDEDFRVVIYRPEIEIREQVTAQGASEGPSQALSQALSDALSQASGQALSLALEQGIKPEIIITILEYCLPARKMAEILVKTGYSDRTKFRNNYIKPLLDDGYLRMTIPNKPQSSNQRYRLTEKGAELLNKVTEVQNDK